MPQFYVQTSDKVVHTDFEAVGAVLNEFYPEFEYAIVTAPGNDFPDTVNGGILNVNILEAIPVSDVLAFDKFAYITPESVEGE